MKLLFLSSEEVEKNYRHYVMAVEEQNQILSRRADFSGLQEVFSRLPSLRAIVMDNDSCFADPERNSPFRVFFDYSRQSPEPQGA